MITTTLTGRGAEDGGGWVLVLDGDGQMRALALPERGEIVVGREKACDVALDNRELSRRHARIRIADGWSIEDLGSHNGCEVGGKRIAKGEAVSIFAGEPFAIGPYAAMIVPRPVSNTRSAAGGSRVVIDDATLANPPASVLAVATSAVNIVIQGETGTGKEVLARAIHARSGRRGPMVAINCAALTPALLASELFGHEKGAFTGASDTKTGLFAAAAGGTLLLDEIGEMPLDIQAAMLRVIETREVRRLGAVTAEPIDVRILAASNHDLVALSAVGTFRRDLYYRLAGITLVVPPLRERRHQIKKLVGALTKTALTSSAVARLSSHDWPGNVRELRNTVERAALLAGTGPIDAAHILFDSPETSPPARAGTAVPPPPTDLTPEDETWRQRIVAALDACAGNQTMAAKKLGISRSNLAHKLVLYSIPRPRKG